MTSKNYALTGAILAHFSGTLFVRKKAFQKRTIKRTIWWTRSIRGARQSAPVLKDRRRFGRHDVAQRGGDAHGSIVTIRYTLGVYNQVAGQDNVIVVNQPEKSMYMITVTNLGTQFWLGGTVWRFSPDRANRFHTEEDAKKALQRAKKFMTPSVYKAATIIKV